MAPRTDVRTSRAAEPMIRVVVINFDGGAMTLECLDSVLATQWPADRLDVVMVDKKTNTTTLKVSDSFTRVLANEAPRALR